MYKYIYAFADTKKEIERNMSNNMFICLTHIMYLILFPNSSYVDHWQHEVYAFYPKVSRLSNTKKFPTSEQLYNWSYGKEQDMITDVSQVNIMIQNCCYEENYENIYDAESVSNFMDSVCVKYFHWLSECLSKHGMTLQVDVKEKLTELVSEIKFEDISNGSAYPVKLQKGR